MATATACALLGLDCVVYMGAEDIRRQAPNVLRMRALGAEVREVTSGTATLKDAVNETMRDWVTNVTGSHYVLGSAVGPHPFPTIVRDLQRVIGDEAAEQVRSVEGRLPDIAVACVGGGSNAIGLLSRFIGETGTRLIGVEAAGEGLRRRHAAALAGGTPGVLHGSRSYLLQDDDGQVTEAHSISAGLDYPGVGPQLSALFAGRAAGGAERHRRRGARRGPSADADGGHPAGARAGARRSTRSSTSCAAGSVRAGADRTTSSSWASRVAGTRTSRPSRSGSWRGWPARRARGRVTHERPRRQPGPRVSRRPSSRPRPMDAPRSSPMPWPATPTPRPRWRIAVAQIDAGADLLEIGLPYSDPLADGATLQRASTVALRNGARLDDSIELVGRIHAARPDTPLVAMGYVNQVLGGRDGATVLRRLGEAGVSRLHPRRPHA